MRREDIALTVKNRGRFHARSRRRSGGASDNHGCDDKHVEQHHVLDLSSPQSMLRRIYGWIRSEQSTTIDTRFMAVHCSGWNYIRIALSPGSCMCVLTFLLFFLVYPLSRVPDSARHLAPNSDSDAWKEEAHHGVRRTPYPAAFDHTAPQSVQSPPKSTWRQMMRPTMISCDIASSGM